MLPNQIEMLEMKIFINQINTVESLLATTDQVEDKISGVGHKCQED